MMYIDLEVLELIIYTCLQFSLVLSAFPEFFEVADAQICYIDLTNICQKCRCAYLYTLKCRLDEVLNGINLAFNYSTNIYKLYEGHR